MRIKIKYNEPDYALVDSNVPKILLTKLSKIVLDSSCPMEELSMLIRNRDYKFEVLYDTADDVDVVEIEI